MSSNPNTDDSSDEDFTANVSKPREHRTARKSTAPSQQVSVYSTRRQAARNASKAIASAAVSSFDKSMASFNPELSQREKRKLNRKINPPNTVRKPQGAVYNENGVHFQTGLDICDCLNEKCPGCWFECPKCDSQKCGTDCRNFRKYVVDSIEFHGFDKTVKNPIHLKLHKSGL